MTVNDMARLAATNNKPLESARAEPNNTRINTAQISAAQTLPGESTDFAKILSNKINEGTKLQFSKHAEQRLLSRDIKLSGEQIERIESGVSKAMEKGIRDSLVMIDNVALVVNVRNKIVITAMDGNNENVFTNIDGAVIV